MKDLTKDVLAYLDTNEIPEKWFINDRPPTLNEEFIDELDIQEQINATEMEDSDLSFNNKLLV